MVILTLNCGSSSAKYQVYDWDNKEVMANGVVERIGIDGSVITHKAKGNKTVINIYYFHFSGFDFGKIQNIIYETEQGVTCCFYALRIHSYVFILRVSDNHFI